MTYILGSTCSDGIVLVSDRKITLDGGAAHAYEDKLYNDTRWMVVGSSGTSGLFEKFRERLQYFLNSPAYDGNVDNLTTQIENITRELNTSYREVLGGEDFNVLWGSQTTTGAMLRYIYPVGFTEGVRRYKVIGHGEPYGSFFLKKWWDRSMKMLDVAELGYFIIKYIQDFELDNTVGIGDGKPQVWLIPKRPPTAVTRSPTAVTRSPIMGAREQTSPFNPHQLSANEMSDMEARVLQKIKAYGEMSWRQTS